MEDTPDKVSAESLAYVGRLVELGLRTNAFIIEEPSIIFDENPVNENQNQSSQSQADSKSGSKTLAYIAMFAFLSVMALLVNFERPRKPR